MAEETTTTTIPDGSGQGGPDDAAAQAAAAAAANEGGEGGDAGTGGEGTQEGGDGGTPEGAPESYADFTLAEGVTLDNGAMEVASPLFKDLGLNQDQAQKAVDAFTQIRQAEAKQVSDDFNKQCDDWEASSKADKEFGGDAFNANAASSARAMDTFGSPELRTLFNDTGIGNHPEVFKFFAKVGRTVAEDTPGSGNPPGGKKDRAESMYPED